MFVNGFLKLIEAGIIRREVFNDVVLQQLINRGTIADETVTPQTLRALLDSGRVRAPVCAEDLAYLQRFGVLRPEVRLDGEQLVFDGKRCSSNLHEDQAFDCVCQHMLGSRLQGGIS